MKKTILLLAAAVLAFSASNGFSQGTINFANSGTTLVSTNSGLPGGSGTASTAAAQGIKVELFYQANPNGSLAPAPISAANGIGNWHPIATLVGLFAPGRFNGASLTTGNEVAPGANAWLQVVGWNLASADYTTALTSSTYIGYSGVWAQGTGDGGSLAAVPIIPPTGTFGGIVLTPVPEPSTIALAGLGAAALLAYRRRK